MGIVKVGYVHEPDDVQKSGLAFGNRQREEGEIVLCALLLKSLLDFNL